MYKGCWKKISEKNRHKAHYRSDSIDRLHLARNLGGRGFKSVVSEYDTSVLGAVHYFSTSEDPLVLGTWNVLRSLSEKKNRKTLYSEGIKVVEALSVNGLNFDGNCLTLDGTPIELNRSEKLRKALLASTTGKHTQSLSEKTNFGVFFKHARLLGKSSWAWLVEGRLSPQDEALITATQNRALKTRYREKHVFKSIDSDLCRQCNKEPETIEHILNRCANYSFSLFMDRHDDCLRPVYNHICQTFGLPVPHWKANVSAVAENEKCKLVWDVCLNTLTEMTARRPDVVLYDRVLKRIVVFDMSVPGFTRLSNAFTEKSVKYQKLRTDLIRLNQGWSVCICPIIMSAVGTYQNETMCKALEEAHPSFTREKSEKILIAIQRSALLGSIRIVKNHLVKRL